MEITKERQLKQLNRVSGNSVQIVNDPENYRMINKKLRRVNVTKKFICVLLSVMVLALTIGSIKRYTDITTQSRLNQELSEKITSLEADRDYLVRKLEPYKSTSRIETLAKIELGMDYPRADQFVHINTGYIAEVQSEVSTETGVIEGFKNFFSTLFGRQIEAK